MKKPQDFRKLIVQALKKQDKSKYWLAHLGLDGQPAPNTIYRYLRGELDITGEPLAVLLAAVGISVVPPK